MTPEQRQWLEIYLETDDIYQRADFCAWFDDQLREARIEGARAVIVCSGGWPIVVAAGVVDGVAKSFLQAYEEIRGDKK